MFAIFCVIVLTVAIVVGISADKDAERSRRYNKYLEQLEAEQLRKEKRLARRRHNYHMRRLRQIELAIKNNVTD